MPKIAFVFIFALFLFPACSSKQAGPTDDLAGQPPATAQKTANHYYDFDDILVPRDMELDPKLSFVFESPQVKAGVLVFKGRVDSVSLTNFFINNMLKDGWHLGSSFKYRRTILVFNKPEKDCIINIIDDRFSTSLEVWIAPREGAGTISPSRRSETTLTQ